MKRSGTTTTKLLLFSLILFTSVASVKAQYLWNSDSAFKAGTANSGRIWGYVFGDLAYKGHSDSLKRGGANQYTGIPESRNTFQLRRVYLGYDYNITKKFSVELLLAAENNFPAGNPPSSTAASGDLLQDNSLAFYIKLANIRTKNIWKGTDFVIGQVSTPTFALLSEKLWNYRSIERTITDIRRTPSYDLGATLQGTFDPSTKNFGYDMMVGNGSSAKPEGDNFKWLYGDVYGYFFHKKLVIDAYADYERLNWTSSWHHSRQMLKGFIAYNSAATDKGTNPGSGYTIGVEGFINNLKNDNFATTLGGAIDTVTTKASGISFFIQGDIIPSKLRFFTRLDLYKPMDNIDNSVYTKYISNTGNYNDNSYTGSTPTATGDETYKQMFITGGLDFMPAKNVHFMPNVWYNRYQTQLATSNTNHDIVYRLTFYYVFGK